jgi:quercetin dioxygenase-like cupin family protein
MSGAYRLASSRRDPQCQLSSLNRICFSVTNLLTEVPDESIISRTIYKDQQLNAVLFAFAAGQSLSEHTAAASAIIHVLSGEGVIRLNGETYDVLPGTWIHMQARLPHSIVAKTPLKMLLIMLPKTADSVEA